MIKILEDEFKIYDLKGEDLETPHLIIDTECIVCGRTFKKNRRFKSSRNTCCKYCTNYIIRLKKIKGYYSLCKVCDKAVWNMPSVKRVTCSKECADLLSKILAHERYKTATATGHKKYYGPNWRYQRYLARERDDYTCKKCGIKELDYGHELSVHHIKPFVYFDNYEEANKLSNLLTVCEPCHRKIHSGENHHSKFKKDKIKFKKHS